MQKRNVYRNYDTFRALIISTLAEMIQRTKGNMLTFNSKKVAILADIDTHPVILTLVKDVLEDLRRRGYINYMGRSKHGVKYVVNSRSPLWKAAKEGGIESVARLLQLGEAVAKLKVS